jgi:hypothetical protein
MKLLVSVCEVEADRVLLFGSRVVGDSLTQPFQEWLDCDDQYDAEFWRRHTGRLLRMVLTKKGISVTPRQ